MIKRHRKQEDDQTIWAGKAWQPYVINRGNKLIYILHIASGHATYVFEVPITKEDLLAIKNKTKRRYYLYAALHDPFQNTKNHLTEEEVRWYFDSILHSKQDEFEAFIDLIDEPKQSRIRYLADCFSKE